MSVSIQSSTARITPTFSSRVLRIGDVFCRMLMPSDAETAAEKVKDVPLMRW